MKQRFTTPIPLCMGKENTCENEARYFVNEHCRTPTLCSLCDLLANDGKGERLRDRQAKWPLLYPGAFEALEEALCAEQRMGWRGGIHQGITKDPWAVYEFNVLMGELWAHDSTGHYSWEDNRWHHWTSYP